jgi:dipeptidyl aminopeptidase/acylaminoacyl peptidase
MVARLLASSDIYSRGIIERATIDLPSFLGTSDMGYEVVRQYVTDDPEHNQETLRMASASHYMSCITKPTLILHGEADCRTPIEQAHVLFANLARRDVDVTMVTFPHEGHEMSRSGRPANRVSRHQIIVQWLTRQVLSPDAPPKA